MATPCTIGLQLPNGAVEAVSVSWDGYPANMINRVLPTYDTPQKVREILEGGRVSFLDTYGSPRTQFYIRDFKRTYAANKSRVYDSVQKYIDDADGLYAYLFRDGKWALVGA